MAEIKNTILLTGGTGKISSRIAPLLSKNGNHVVVASRSGNSISLPNVNGATFDWMDPSTFANLFEGNSISAIFIVAPPVFDCISIVRPFIDLAIRKGVKRFVILGATSIDPNDGPMAGQISKYILSLNVEYAILRPTWFMGKLSELISLNFAHSRKKTSPKYSISSLSETKTRSSRQQEMAEFLS